MQKGAMQTHRTFSSESIHVCLCLCDNTNIKYILESQKCNISCKTSIIYRAQNDCTKILLCSIDYKEHSIGYCVKSNTGASSLLPIVETFGLYWKYCRNNNRYIVGDTSQTYDSKYKIYQKYYIHIPTATYS